MWPICMWRELLLVVHTNISIEDIYIEYLYAASNYSLVFLYATINSCLNYLHRVGVDL
jgi:hypothetical protein